MNLFHDTSSIIAYCFINDSWNKRAEIVFERYPSHYTSNRVIDEFREKEEEIIEEFHSKISEFSEKIRGSNKNVFYVDDRTRLPRKADRSIQGFVREVLELMEFPKSREELADLFMDLYIYFLKVKNERFDELIESVLKIHSRDMEYPELEEKLKEIGIHNGKRDRGILLDAHDLAVTSSISVCFVTTDDYICEENKQKVLDLLQLIEIIDLRYMM